MSTTGPAAGAAHAALELRDSFLDTDTSRLRLLAGGDPTDPLIARERRNIFPHCSSRRRLNQGLLPIIRHCMNRTVVELVFGHTTHVIKSIRATPKYCR